MDYTQNLHLPQWEETDRIHHDDFNDAFAAIDAACAAAPKIAVGFYTGDGTLNRTISLDYTPRIVIVWFRGYRQFDEQIYGGIAAVGVPVNTPAVAITENGFRVSNEGGYRTNVNNEGYTYLTIV